MYKTVILTTGFGEFEFFRALFLFFFLSKSAGKFKLTFAKRQNVLVIQIPQMSKSAVENSNFPIPVASITISYILCALKIGTQSLWDNVPDPIIIMRASILVLLFLTMTYATMNVGTFWFMQNSGQGKFLKKLPISIRPDQEGPQQEEVRKTFDLWWDSFRKWNRLIKIK